MLMNYILERKCVTVNSRGVCSSKTGRLGFLGEAAVMSMLF